MASRRPPDSTRIPTINPAAPTPPDPESTPGAKAATPRKPRAPRAAKSTAGAKSVSTPLHISQEARRGMIAEAAYLRAERRGFTGGPEQEREDWLAAETEVDALLRAGHGSSAQ
jgi:hypothetical protein